MALQFPIFMDYHSTTPVDQRVLDEMIPYFTQKFGNEGKEMMDAFLAAIKAAE